MRPVCVLIVTVVRCFGECAPSCLWVRFVRCPALCVLLRGGVSQVSMECDNDTDLQSPIRSLAGMLLVLTVLIPVYVADRPTPAPAVVRTHTFGIICGWNVCVRVCARLDAD